jgi:hypothetical protein
MNILLIKLESFGLPNQPSAAISGIKASLTENVNQLIKK